MGFLNINEGITSVSDCCVYFIIFGFTNFFEPTSFFPFPESENENNIELMEEDDFKGPPKLFAISVVNSYGNSNVFDLANDGNPITLKKDSYLALDWQSKAKELFYNEKVAEEFSQNDSYHAKPSQKKQVVRLEECLELYTTKEKLGEDDAW